MYRNTDTVDPGFPASGLLEIGSKDQYSCLVCVLEGSVNVSGSPCIHSKVQLSFVCGFV